MNPMVANTLNDGDEIVTDADPGERYTVVAVHESKAWIRDLKGESEMIVDRHRCARVDLLN
ncbi:hypothetical protein [Brevundimonas sp. R86498]|uniref:hypothetical protein n=1 Tax=Brevundimonas sp. R86498 TaxID=3093845 RepID=UPI0037CC0931